MRSVFTRPRLRLPTTLLVAGPSLGDCCRSMTLSAIRTGRPAELSGGRSNRRCLLHAMSSAGPSSFPLTAAVAVADELIRKLQAQTASPGKTHNLSGLAAESISSG